MEDINPQVQEDGISMQSCPVNDEIKSIFKQGEWKEYTTVKKEKRKFM